MVLIRLESDQERWGSAGKELENYYIDDDIEAKLPGMVTMYIKECYFYSTFKTSRIFKSHVNDLIPLRYTHIC